MALRAHKQLFRIFTLVAVALTAIAATAVFVLPGDADAKKKKSKRSVSTKSLPTVSSIEPQNISIGESLKIKGKNFTLGNNKMLVVFKRDGGRRFTAKGTATARNEMTVSVPDVSLDLPNGQPSLYRLRLVNRYGMSKKATTDANSPIISIGTGGTGAVNGDCDGDKVPDTLDTDDDNDMLNDDVEVLIGTKVCGADSEGDGMSDYYEYIVATEFNGGPILPYPLTQMRPDPNAGDSSNDFDGDGLAGIEEYLLWRYTGRMDRFYSDADQDSDNNGTTDENEDEDADLLTNYVEKMEFGPGTLPGLSMLMTDSDGDGLCDGLDDQDHDGSPTAVADGDCSSAVPNNVVPGDPNPALIDGDDNVYSNYAEILFGSGAYDACDPNPASPYCPLH